MAASTWELEQQLNALLPLSDDDISQIIKQADSLPPGEASEYLSSLCGDSPDALRFISAFRAHQAEGAFNSFPADSKTSHLQPSPGMDVKHPIDERHGAMNGDAPPSYAPPSGAPPNRSAYGSEKAAPPSGAPASFAAPSGAPPTGGSNARANVRHHSNPVIEAGKVRARDEQEMQQMLQNLQYQYGIYNTDIEPEHETEYPCSCPIHRYQNAKYRRYGVQDMWSKAVMYPGEKAYDDNKFNYGGPIFSSNPYRMRVVSPYGWGNRGYMAPNKPQAGWHAKSIHQTISLNNALNKEAQADINAKEPKHSIWDEGALERAMDNIAIGGDKKNPFADTSADSNPRDEKASLERRKSSLAPSTTGTERPKTSKLASFRKTIGIKSSEERAVGRVEKAIDKGKGLRAQIIDEENGRWPDAHWQQIVLTYQDKVGMTKKIAELRSRSPIQYLHLLRAGYFEPIPVAWANQASNPLKFSIEAAAGWRGITPVWRGYEDTAEERLYWVLNHREDPEGSTRTRLKPDFISEMDMARARMARAVEPPPSYFDALDTCHVQHTSEGYSAQVMPPPFHAYDRPEQASDDTMILLDVSGSMDFQPVRPVYEQYLITRYEKGTQPKNKDVAKAIIRRFTDAMANHDHQSAGYDLITFSSQAHHIGTVNHKNLDRMWSSVRIGGGTRVMTGWQKVKELHFQKHSESATYHPIYGWQAGPQTPMLRMLLLLDGEATDMDEFELDLLSLSWAHVTIFLVGVEGCPHHHRHANELQRISDVNHHVSFVDAQGNTPERYVTHELLKRHLGYDVSMQEFEAMEQLPEYTVNG